MFSTEGFVTFILEGDHEVRSTSYFWNVLRNNYSPMIFEKVKGMRFLRDKKGVIFDLPEKFSEDFVEIGKAMETRGFKCYKAKELPELEEK